MEVSDMRNVPLLRLSELFGGAADERFADALEKVLENIADPNTDATAARKVSVELTFKPAESRERFDLDVVVKTKTAARAKVSTLVYCGRNPDGSFAVSEYVPPTQKRLDEALTAPAAVDPTTGPGTVVPGRFTNGGGR